jgi:hypothetical protein
VLLRIQKRIFWNGAIPKDKRKFLIELCTRVFVTLGYGVAEGSSEDFDPLPPLGGLPRFLGGKTTLNGPSRGR